MTAPPHPHRTDGDGWVECSCGNRHWGRYGAAGLLLHDPDRGVLLQHRASWSHYGDTWGVPGGARASDESAVTGAVREAAEEAAVVPELVRADLAFIEDHGDWSYTTVVATATGPFEPFASDAESHEIRWVPVDEVTDRPLLPAFAAMWPRIRPELGRRATLVVDAANVVGSRPDGWWRDRAGATAGLRDRLAAADGLPVDVLRASAAQLSANQPSADQPSADQPSADRPNAGRANPDRPSTDSWWPEQPSADHWWPDIVLVVEGRARDVASVPGVRVVSAPRDGDDMILAVTATAIGDRPGDPVVVVTADRELRRRVTNVGATSTGPGALRAVLDRL